MFGLSPGIAEPDNGTNDIDASSDCEFGLDGTVIVTTPEVDPSEGFGEFAGDCGPPPVGKSLFCGGDGDR